VSRPTRVALKSVVWVVCLLPLVMLLEQFWAGDLGANPISHATNVLGDATLRILLASLALTPLRLLSGVAWPMCLRRLLGLFAFFYALLHFTVWVAIDQFFDWAAMLADLRKRPYIMVGMLALTCLVPLAATSTTRMVKRLGGRAWQRLHRLVYLAGLAAILHLTWLAKKGRNDPYAYAAILAVLLGVRVWHWAAHALRRRGRPAFLAPGPQKRAVRAP
jgi:methionine sulfoxide reductase heme-binding subunit